jgi:hypothetical protein
MTNNIKISCIAGATDTNSGLGLELWVDDQCLYNNECVDSDAIPVEIEIADNEGERELRFVMKNKTVAHTKIDEDGNIVSDARLTLSDISFDGIKLGYLFTKFATYTHDFNGTGTQTEEKFFGEMGCNGTVSLKFSSPFYLWLLEHM